MEGQPPSNTVRNLEVSTLSRHLKRKNSDGTDVSLLLPKYVGIRPVST